MKVYVVMRSEEVDGNSLDFVDKVFASKDLAYKYALENDGENDCYYDVDEWDVE